MAVFVSCIMFQILNHMLKNSVSGACALIEIELTDRCESCAQRDGLANVVQQLHQTIEWCVMRQVSTSSLEFTAF